MAYGQGSIELDFGSFPGSNEASVDVTGLTGITSTQSADAWIMHEPSSQYSANDQSYANLITTLTCTAPTTGVGFTIYARCTEKLQGKILVRYVWA